MPNFCPNCGKPVGKNDKFCKECGANLIPQKSTQPVQPQQTPQIQAPQRPTQPAPSSINALGIIETLFIIGVVVLGLALVFYTFGCLTGIIEPGADEMCRSLSPSFSSGSGYQSTYQSGQGQTVAQQYCSPGYCLSNGHCCPSNYRYYCEGKCYATREDAMSASQGRCSSFQIYC